ncbi:methyltransferase domain-containing protein [Nocardiopsis sp. RSe5-2]|uniref:Methyltransferase domain-containing protein n=1 Tax=Nocardiopsis endophytica TaxID=3018445 RepID=A0ABT4TYB7_9ACTN|nr:methyltransferase domain-containing protein [Nocardiopsis endophytica]MDA2809127.1 methyltransferase domain-containing protein [Nocardiopsis endophytica]
MGARLMARTLRGLEEVSAREIEERGLGTVERLRHREVWFSSEDPGPRLLDLRTVDDVFLLAAALEGIGHTKAELDRFPGPARAAPWRDLSALRGRCGGPSSPTRIDVVASYLGKRNFNRYDIEDAVGREASDVLGLPYVSRREGRPPEGGEPFPIRVTLEGPEAALAVRLTGRPMHRRAYKQESVPGTLHPPLAAAMARLAGVSGLAPGARVLDPTCGTGTLLIEARRLAPGAHLLGTDADPDALRGAAANSADAAAEDPAAGKGAPIAYALADAGRLPLADGTVDRVVGNPPWGLQVEPHGSLARRPKRYFGEVQRVLARDGGRAVLLLHDPDAHLPLAASVGLRVRDSFTVSLFGTHPSVVALER